MLMEADMIRSGTAERIARLSDEAPGAEMAARVVLAQVCARAGWDAARIELRTEGERRPLWHVRPRAAAPPPAALARAPPADPGSGAGSRRGAAPRAQLPLRRAGGGDALE